MKTYSPYNALAAVTEDEFFDAASYTSGNPEESQIKEMLPE